MILIKSSFKDTSTFQVAEWLLYLDMEFSIICETDIIESFNYSYDKLGASEIQFKTTSSKSICLNQINAFWYRRGKFTFKEYSSESLSKEFSESINNEWSILNNSLFEKLERKRYLGNYSKRTPNKLDVLALASSVGIVIPKTLITDSKGEVEKYFEGQTIINKTIADVFYHINDDIVYSNKTVLVDLPNLPSKFYPSLFQSFIDKKYELRVFFIEDMFYSMAIFSQLDSKTEVDYRNYNYLKPNRCVPYKLSSDIEVKLRNLIKELGLNTGSIDLIVAKDGTTYFLEVNPNGQFGMVSDPCNYYIERLIANKLC